MFNANKPSLDELPSTAQLLRSTAIAAVGAVGILVTVVLPAEYGIDPTRVGRLLGLTDMGEIKQELNDEAEQDLILHGDQTSSLVTRIADAIFGVAYAEELTQWRDTISFTLQPSEFTEVKLVMQEGQVAQFEWVSEGARVNFDLHAHGGGQSHTYEKGRGAVEGAGEMIAPFDGEHGWFWRNRDKKPVTVLLNIKGDYLSLVPTE